MSTYRLQLCMLLCTSLCLHYCIVVWTSFVADRTLVSTQVSGEEHSIFEHQGDGKVHVSLGRGPEPASSYRHTKFGYKHCCCPFRGEKCAFVVFDIKPQCAQWGAAGPATATGVLSVYYFAFAIVYFVSRLLGKLARFGLVLRGV